MGFSAKQLQALRRNLDHRCIRTRTDHGRELSYIEGWHAIAEANRIFGFDGWNRETLDARSVLAREVRGTFSAIYTAKVRITVQANGQAIVREGHGTGESRGSQPGEVHDMALKAAETDATKRALATFGRPFGLALYLSGKHASRAKGLPLLDFKDAQQPAAQQSKGGTSGLTAWELNPARVEKCSAPAKATGIETNSAKRVDPSPASLATNPATKGIDKSVLTLNEPKRHRDKYHLKYVTTQACLLCGRTPSDAHHLQFAQPRAIGVKVSDEFTVPLCRLHHRYLHDAGDEVAWWNDIEIDPMPIAQSLWQESKARCPANDNVAPKQGDDRGQPAT
jgi:hypothetical protein